MLFYGKKVRLGGSIGRIGEKQAAEQPHLGGKGETERIKRRLTEEPFGVAAAPYSLTAIVLPTTL